MFNLSGNHMEIRRHRRKSPSVVLFVLGITCAPTLVAGFGYIIFDPSNFAKNVHQAIALLQQIARASEQIRQQLLMLAHLPDSIADALTQAAQALDIQLTASFDGAGLDAGSVAGQLESQYPITFPEPVPGWLDTQRHDWTQQEREQLIRERDLAQHVQDQMAPTAQRLTKLVEASNGVNVDRLHAPGVVAVAQAHQELLGLCSGEMDKLIAVRAARARRHVDARAHSQSELAYIRSRRDYLMIDWNGAEQSKPRAVRNPF